MIKQKYISKRFDEAAVLVTLSKLAFEPEPELVEGDYMVMSALQRSSPDWNLTIEDTGTRLASYSDDQIAGLVSNVKGILHEMEFVRLENDDGDSIVASLYPDTNHKSVDVQLLDQNTGDTWSVQLKATDDIGYVNSWIDSNPDTEIIVTDELANQMDLPTSGLNNDDLTVRVEDFVNRMLELESSGHLELFDDMPPFIVISSGIIVFELWRRYRRGDISLSQFKQMTFMTLGIKTAKYGVLFSALAVPGLNVIVGAYMLASMILALNRSLDNSPPFRPLSFLAARQSVCTES